MISTPTPARILVVDDDPQELEALSNIVCAWGYKPVTAANGAEALEKLGSEPVDAILTDLMMPVMDGFQLLKSLMEQGDPTPAIVLTGFGSVDQAVSIVQDLRAFWFLEKPAQPTVLAPLLERAIRHKRLLAKTDKLQRELSYQGLLEDLVGTSASMRQVFTLIQRVAPTTASVLISGENGTGKDRVASAIHRLSPRAEGPFHAVNCAAIPETLMESELFGHEKGAFTGALDRHAGCFEQAHRGTLFLDEIAEMPVAMQAKLLRVLEDSKVRRLGGKSEITVDVRVLAATNRPIREALEKKVLREDLYYRLNVFQIDLPPLRERREDIPPLAEALIRSLNERHNCHVTDLHGEALKWLMENSWSGNVRELRNVLERAVIVAREGTILPVHLPKLRAAAEPEPTLNGGLSMTVGPGKQLREIEDAYIQLTLQHTANKKQAAEKLGISIRTLHTRLAELAAAAKQENSAARGASCISGSGGQ